MARIAIPRLANLRMRAWTETGLGVTGYAQGK